MENYFLLLKSKDDEINALTKNLTTISNLEAKMKEEKQKLEQEYFDILHKYEELSQKHNEDYIIDTLKSIMLLIFILTIISPILVFHLSLPIFFYFLIPSITSLIELLCFKITQIIHSNYTNHRTKYFTEILNIQEALQKASAKKDAQAQDLTKLNSKKSSLLLKLNIARNERENLRDIILQEFYPLLITTFNETNMQNKDEYEEVIKRIRTNISKAYPPK